MLTKTKLAVSAAGIAAVVGATALASQPAFAGPGAHGMHFQGGMGGGGDWWRFHHHHGGGWIGPAVGFGAGVAVGSALAAPYYAAPYYAYDEPYYGYDAPVYTYSRPYDAYNDADAYCAARFRTYDPVTHTYMGYDGLPHPCP